MPLIATIHLHFYNILAPTTVDFPVKTAFRDQDLDLQK